LKKIIISMIAGLSALTFVVPASTAPLFTTSVAQASSDVTAVQYRRDRRHSDRYERRGRDTYWRGHRGYRHARPGYRRQGDFWFPPAAFALGAIVGGAVANQEPRYRPRGGAHAEWCANRYRSYRASDNTFQPYNGPRRQCTSPYG
jgi:hypothetical protein